MRKILTIGILISVVLGLSIQTARAQYVFERQRISGTLRAFRPAEPCSEAFSNAFSNLIGSKLRGDATVTLVHEDLGLDAGRDCRFEVRVNWSTSNFSQRDPLRLIALNSSGEGRMEFAFIEPLDEDADFVFTVTQFDLRTLFENWAALYLERITAVESEEEAGDADVEEVAGVGIVLPRDPAVGAGDLAIGDAGGLVPLDPNDLDLAGPPRDRYIGNAPDTTVQDFPDDLTPDQNLQTGGGACQLNPMAEPQGFAWGWIVLAGLVWLRRRKK